MKLAPICLFTYNRLEETKQTIAALQNNYLSKNSELIIFSDGGKDKIAQEKVQRVRAFLKTISGFKKVEIIEAAENKGLANSIIAGVTKVVNEYDKVIVLEDDLITAPNFLDFMNQALTFYKNNERVYSISAYSMDLPSLKCYKKDYYMGYRASSWGWGTWKVKWQDVDWEVKDYNAFNSNLLIRQKFNRGGSDLSRMLKNQMNGKIDSWAIRWCYHQFNKDMLTVFSTKSKVTSIGFGVDATHTKSTKRFDTLLDTGNQTEFTFSNDITIDRALVKEFKYKFSILLRLKDRF
jgi:hypothetical protein